MVGIFISHSWKKATSEYEELAYNIKKWIREDLGEVTDNSIPEERRITSWTSHLPGVLPGILKERIKKSDIFLLVAYPKPTQWIEREVDFAIQEGKPILAVKPPEYERMAGLVNEHRLTHVNYDMRSVRAAVRRALNK